MVIFVRDGHFAAWTLTTNNEIANGGISWQFLLNGRATMQNLVSELINFPQNVQSSSSINVNRSMLRTLS